MTFTPSVFVPAFELPQPMQSQLMTTGKQLVEQNSHTGFSGKAKDFRCLQCIVVGRCVASL